MIKNLRLTIVIITFILLFSAVLIRLFYWQIVTGEKLATIADNQHFFTLELPAKRGEIVDSSKNPLVANEISFMLIANFKNINIPKTELVSKLSNVLAQEEIKNNLSTNENNQEIINQKKDELKTLLNNPNIIWVPLAHKISSATKKEIDKLDIKGLEFENEEKRFYPEGSSSAHLLGFVGKDINGKDKGYFGLEGYYDLQLKGKNGELRQEKDALGRPIILGDQDEIKPKKGRTLVSTIDKSIQIKIEKHLKNGIENYGAKGGSVIVMDPNSGAILGMASFPSYDPINFQKYDKESYKNPVVADAFEPGSIMKPLIMSAALEENKIKPDTKCPKCSNPRVIGDYVIKTFNDVYHPNLTMTEILENSDNTGMVYVGEILGKAKVYQYLKKFGFGELTEIDLQEEEQGSVKNSDDWYPIDAATVTFGQGIAVTQIQMIRAFSALANGGNLVKPFIVQKIIDQEKEIDVTPKESTKILKSEVSKVISEMLVSVTEKSPLHFPKDRIPELSKYRIAAKSGTAQIPISGHYDPNKTIGSVIGFAPAENPKFIVLVRLLEPSVRTWGSDTAGPIFFNIVKDLLTYYGINPKP